MKEFAVRRICLNGWWDFIPIFDPAPDPQIPFDGWHEGKYLVPSFWTKSTHGVRKRGETYYYATRNPEIFESDDYEFLFDAFGYPPEWSKTRTGWVRRTLTLDGITRGHRYFLVFDAVMPKTRLFVNGQAVVTARVGTAAHIHPTLPLETDVTDYLHTGDNEIVVHIADYDRDDKGRALVPTGNLIPCDHSGIWQDVWLVERAAIYLSDLTIRSSTRQKTLTVEFEVTNTTDHDANVTIQPDILDWQKGASAEDADHVKTFPPVRLHIPAGQTASTEITYPWPDAEWWCPENPKLYWLKTAVSYQPSAVSKSANQRVGESNVATRSAKDSTIQPSNHPTTQPTTHNPQSTTEISFTRFGFREIRLDGPNIMLNDHPIHLFSDWGHKSTPYYYTEGWIRQWFGMMRDANMNHSRLHTHPHPQIYMDLADEEGILITGETGLHGSGGAQAAASPEYWKAAADHVRRFVQRDKNHPSVILWSVENEMRWNTKGQGRNPESVIIQEELPKLRALFNRLDPTRPAYHDGDSSLWNEKAQDIISRHYGKEVAGIGWWDQTQPLCSGEMSFYHYAGPNNTLHLGNNTVYANFEAIDKAAAMDTALIIETGRTLGVSCFGPWNLSCLENLRMETEDMKLDYDDFTVPGVKPLRVPAHSSEFSFWRDGKGYVPNHSFDIQARAFRPFAVIDRSQKSTCFTGTTFQRKIFVVNDTLDKVQGTLEIILKAHRARQADSLSPPMCERHKLSIPRGHVTSQTISIPLLANATPGTYTYTATFRADDQILDSWTREIHIQCPAFVVSEANPSSIQHLANIAVFGPGLLKQTLTTLGIDFTYIDSLESIPSSILILEKNTVQPGGTQNKAVQAFVQNGGRIIVMEQAHSLFPAAPLEDKPVLTAFVRAADHPVLNNINDTDLAFWGDDPYPLIASDAYVANKLYRKDDGRLMLPLLDSGEGGFGHGDLELTPLFEAQDGDGLILTCQLRLTDKLDEIPAAEQLFVNLLQRATNYQPQPSQSPILVEGRKTHDFTQYIDAAQSGQTVIVNNATPESLHAWGASLSVDLYPRYVGEVYQIVKSPKLKVQSYTLLAGISNWDICGIETYAYTHNAENVQVGETFLEPIDGLEALLVTPTESCLRALFVYNGRSEALRTHTLSRFLHAEKRKQAVALGRIKVGEGQIIFNQFAPPQDKRTRYARLSNRLMANSGQRFEGSLLDGELSESAQAASPGYPQQLYAYAGLCDAARWQAMVDSTLPSLERMLATPILNVANWTTHTAQDGIWQSTHLSQPNQPTTRSSHPTTPIYLYYPVWSPAPRKNIETNLDVPNPEALTFIDIEGTGTVEVVINGHTHATTTLPTTISDLSLEMGGNHVLLKWTPDHQNTALKMQWRNIMHQPETGLTFGDGGTVD